MYVILKILLELFCTQNLYDSALFWADKVATLSCNTPKDVYWLAHCMFLLKQYHRAVHIIRSKELEKVLFVFCREFLMVHFLFRRISSVIIWSFDVCTKHTNIQKRCEC